MEREVKHDAQRQQIANKIIFNEYYCCCVDKSA